MPVVIKNLDGEVLKVVESENLLGANLRYADLNLTRFEDTKF